MNTKMIKFTLSGLLASVVFLTGFVVNADTYTVKAGDTLSQIAKDKKTTIENLVALNNIKNPDFISVGQVLELDMKKLSSQQKVAQSAVPASSVTYSAETATPVYPNYEGYTSSVALANGNTAGETGSYAAARMAELTGVSASTWENIIARESNGQVNAYNPSGASGLFQTMPGWGSTATVEDQIQAAYRAYSAQGLSAWNY